MKEPLLYLATMVVAFAGMEWVAWATHKHVMHRWMWPLHRDHHQTRPGVFQKNDAFVAVFAVPSWLGIMLGMMFHAPIAVAAGVGIALYGATYVVVHELFIHQRITLRNKFWRKTNSVYLLAMRKAHRQHHKHLAREDGECFGMLWVSSRYLDQARRQLARKNS